MVSRTNLLFRFQINLLTAWVFYPKSNFMKRWFKDLPKRNF